MTGRPFFRTEPVFLGLALLTFVVGACSQAAVVLPSRDLDRPTDMTFACVSTVKQAADGQVLVSGEPMGKCHPSGKEDPAATLPTTAISETPSYRTYSFVTNTDRGDLSVIDMSYCRSNATECQPPGAQLVDLDPLAVGYEGVPVGEWPEAVVASQDGCRLVTANRGSCDLTMVDPSVLLARHLNTTTNGQVPSRAAKDAITVVPLMATGRLQVAPGEIAFVPQQTGLLPQDARTCDPDVAGALAPPVGDPAPAAGERVPWRVVVTFPSCDLIALIELPSGIILDSYQVGGTPSQPVLIPRGQNPVCAATDCPFVPPAPASDAGVDDAGTGSPGTRVGTIGISALAIHPEGDRVYFGGTNTPSVFVLDIAGKSFVPPTAAPTVLSENAGGAVRMRLSINPFDFSKGYDAQDVTRPQYGRFVAGRHDNQVDDPLEFLYVIAKDGSLRVLDVARQINGVAQTRPIECDLNIDPTDPLANAVPRAVPPDDNPTNVDSPTRAACFAYKDPKGPRRLLSGGIPGRRFSSAPQDIAFANYHSPIPSPPSEVIALDEEYISGAFAFVMTNAGGVYVLNIDPDLRVTRQVVKAADGKSYVSGSFAESPRPLTHSSRDFNVLTYSTSLGTTVGPSRVDTAPTTIVDGPQLMKFKSLETRADARVVPTSSSAGVDSYVYFPNRATVRAQTWHIQWEGDISSVRVTGDIVEPDPSAAALSPLVTVVTDNGAGFCSLGGGDGDIMTLVGCDTDSNCQVGSVCVHSKAVATTADGRAIQGMCLPRSKTTYDECEPMLASYRRYEIVSTPSNTRTLVVPRMAEVPRPVTTINGERATCDPTKIVQGLSTDCTSASIASQKNFACVNLTKRPDGSPLRDTVFAADGTTVVQEGDPRWRCLEHCDDTHKCRAGRTCVTYPDGDFCAEGAPIVEGCGLDQLFAYKLSAGNAFLVTGSVAGRTEALKSVTGLDGLQCVPDPAAPVGVVARIRMNIPECAAGSTPIVHDDVTKTDSIDPDFLARDTVPNVPTPNPCLFSDPTAPNTKSSPATGAVFQNTELRFVLTNLQKQLRDTAQIQFTVNGGMSPQLVVPSSDSTPGLPSRILLGPIPSQLFSVACPADRCPPAGDTTSTLAGSLPGRFSDLPYLYVVDQRAYSGGRLGARGQILRIAPRFSASVPYTGFETFSSSGNYFPIQ